MLKSVIYEDFKSFRQAELTLAQISFLIGTNASGKSNAIEGMRILSELATGRDISVVLDGSNNVDSKIRGGSHGCLRPDCQSFALGCRVDLSGGEYVYSIRIHVGEHNYVEAESLRHILPAGQADTLFCTKDAPEDSMDIMVAYTNGKRGRNPEINCIRSMAVLPQLPGKLPSGKGTDPAIKCLTSLAQELRRVLFLDPVPSQMRDYARIRDDRLRPEADNLSAVLYALCGDGNKPQEKQQRRKQAILDVIKGLPENEIEDLQFVTTQLNDVIFTLREAYSPEPIDAKRLSDGTMRCLAIITALISEPEHSLIVVEEIDNGLHPGRVSALLEHLAKISEKRHLSILVTTHNPALLNAVSGNLLGGVSLCYRKKDDASSAFVRLVDMPDYFRMAATGRVGDLLTQGVLLDNLKQPHKPVDLQWLEKGMAEHV